MMWWMVFKRLRTNLFIVRCLRVKFVLVVILFAVDRMVPGYKLLPLWTRTLLFHLCFVASSYVGWFNRSPSLLVRLHLASVCEDIREHKWQFCRNVRIVVALYWTIILAVTGACDATKWHPCCHHAATVTWLFYVNVCVCSDPLVFVKACSTWLTRGWYITLI